MVGFYTLNAIKQMLLQRVPNIVILTVFLGVQYNKFITITLNTLNTTSVYENKETLKKIQNKRVIKISDKMN